MNKEHATRPVLLIEDNPADVDLTLRAFKRRNLANPIQVIRDGEEALIYVNQWRPGQPLPLVVLLDLKLPRVDGLEVLRQMKRHAEFGKVPVVVLTSSAEDRDVERAYQLGVGSYIIKPVDFAKFLDVAEQIELYWCLLNLPPR